MKVHYPKLYNMAHSLALNVLLLPKDLTIIFIQFMHVFELPQIDTNQQDRLSFGRNINYFNIIE